MAVLTAKTQYNLTNARDYFEEHLRVGDYYDEGQRVSGELLGLGAQRLGLAGRVRADDFLPLCENQHPVTGEMLTQRLNTTWVDGDGSSATRRMPKRERNENDTSLRVVRIARACAQSSRLRAVALCQRRLQDAGKCLIFGLGELVQAEPDGARVVAEAE